MDKTHEELATRLKTDDSAEKPESSVNGSVSATDSDEESDFSDFELLHPAVIAANVKAAVRKLNAFL